MATSSASIPVPHSIVAFYGSVPREEQLLEIERLEIIPLPLTVGNIVFASLRGEIPAHKRLETGNTYKSDRHLLTNATVQFTIYSLNEGSGLPTWERAETFPLRTIAFSDSNRLTIRDGTTGRHVDFLSNNGRCEITTEYLVRGTPGNSYRVRVLARACDKTLFDFFFEQKLGSPSLLPEGDGSSDVRTNGINGTNGTNGINGINGINGTHSDDSDHSDDPDATEDPDATDATDEIDESHDSGNTDDSDDSDDT